MWRKLIKGDKLWLVGCLGSEPRLAPSQKRMSGALVKPPHLGRGVRAVLRLNIVPPGFALQLRKITKNSQGSRKVLG